MGVAKTNDEAVAFARVLDEAGVVLLFRDKVHLHPNKAVIVKGSVRLPLALRTLPVPVTVPLAKFPHLGVQFHFPGDTEDFPFTFLMA
ncbi:hypothetical protein LguiA_000598 [Lonicera macranthoides]